MVQTWRYLPSKSTMSSCTVLYRISTYRLSSQNTLLHLVGSPPFATRPSRTSSSEQVSFCHQGLARRPLISTIRSSLQSSMRTSLTRIERCSLVCNRARETTKKTCLGRRMYRRMTACLSLQALTTSRSRSMAEPPTSKSKIKARTSGAALRSQCKMTS